MQSTQCSTQVLMSLTKDAASTATTLCMPTFLQYVYSDQYKGFYNVNMYFPAFCVAFISFFIFVMDMEAWRQEMSSTTTFPDTIMAEPGPSDHRHSAVNPSYVHTVPNGLPASAPPSQVHSTTPSQDNSTIFNSLPPPSRKPQGQAVLPR
jgi:hypothetical protein